jgi:hypothetical protein
MESNSQQSHFGTVNVDKGQQYGASVGVNNGSVTVNQTFQTSPNANSSIYPASLPIDPTALNTRFTIERKDSSVHTILNRILISSIHAKLTGNRIVIIQARKDLLSRLVIEEAARFFHGRNPAYSLRIFENILQYDNSNNITNAFDLCSELQSVTEASIWLVPNASREHVGWMLDEVRVTAEASGHYLLVTTELAQELWHLQPLEDRYWLDIRSMTIFDPTYLPKYLLQELARRQSQLPHELQQKANTSDHIINATLTVSSVAQKLQSPINIEAWLQAVIRSHETGGSPDYEALINEYASNDFRHIFNRWFNNALTRTEQLLLLAVYVLEGATERQILAALQDLMYNKWNVSGNISNFVDRIHLQKLYTFYTFKTDHFADLPVKGFATVQRDELQRLLLQNYHQHLENTILWIPKVVRESFDRGAVESTLFGLPEQRDALRNAISTTLSDLGITARDIVLPTYFQLIADQKSPVHFFLGRALSQWYTKGYVSQLTSLLNDWYSDTKVLARINRVYLDLYTATTGEMGSMRHTGN